MRLPRYPVPCTLSVKFFPFTKKFIPKLSWANALNFKGHQSHEFAKFNKFLSLDLVKNMNNVSVWISLMSRQGQRKEFFTDDEREECTNH